MKILKIEITAFGKWRQKNFDFTDGNQLIYGENEAGKSTIYQFIQAIIFGFPSKGRKKNDYTPKDGSAYGGRIWLFHPVYGEFVVERFKQQNRGKAKVTLRTQSGSDELLEQLLIPLTKELFQQVFTFQQEQLTELDQLREKELHDALISLGIIGSSYVFQKRKDYYQEAQQMFKKKGQKLIINKKLNEWKQLQEKIQQKQAQESVFRQLVKEEQSYKEKQTQLRKSLDKLAEKISLIKQQELNFSLYEEWQELKKNTSCELPEDQFLQELEIFSNRYQQTNERLKELEATLENNNKMDCQSAHYYFYLEYEDSLKKLLHQQSKIQQMMDEWQKLQIEIRETEAELTILEQRWQWTRSQTPKEFLQDETWKKMCWTNHQLKEQENQLNICHEIVIEQQKIIEKEINDLEKIYPMLLQMPVVEDKRKISWFLMGVAGLLMPIGIFSSTSLKFLFFILALVIGEIGVYQLNVSSIKKNQLTEIKGKWQEKLSQLDSILAKIEEISQNKENNLEKQQSFQREVMNFSINYHLGLMNTFITMQEYGQEVTDYLVLCENFVCKQHRIQEIQQRLVQIDQTFEFVKEWLSLQDKTLTEKMCLLGSFVQEMEQMKFARSYQQNTMLKQEINQLKKKQKLLLQRYSSYLEQIGVLYPSELGIYLQKVNHIKQQVKRLSELNKILTPIFPKEISKEQLLMKLSSYKEQQYKLQLQEKKVSEQRQRLKLQVEDLQRDGTLDELYQQASLQQSNLQNLFELWGGLMIAGNFLSDLSTEMSERHLPQLLKSAGYYLGILTDFRYKTILLKHDMLTLTDGYTDFPIYELSTGTKDQLIMAMRFAYLSLESKRLLCPIIIDDGWLHYDHQRKYRLAKLLAKFGKNYQVICFSSDQEMVSYYIDLKQSVKQLEGVINEKNL